jgi:DNA-binding SARP family transcriptional activator
MGAAEASHCLHFQVLGPLLVRHNGVAVKMGTRRQRALLVLLLINVGRTLSAERLIDQLWQGDPPPKAAVTLRSYISSLRQALRAVDDKPIVVTRGQGYGVDVDRSAVDFVCLENLVETGRRQLEAGEVEEALESFSSGLELWRGEPLPEVAELEAAQATIARVHELRLGAAEGRFEALLALGRHRDALPSLEAFVSENPFREHPRAQLMLALYRDGRAPEALDVHRDFRSILGEELGLDPSPALDTLMQQMLAQSSELDGPSVPASPRQEPAQEPRTAPGADQHVVGRGLETQTLTAAVDRLADEGTGGLLLLAGEPGIGKTTMLTRLGRIARQRGVASHSGRSVAATGAPAFWPWTQVITSVAESLDDEGILRALRGGALAVTQVAESVAARLGPRHEVTGDDPREVRFLLYEAVTRFLEQACEEAPLVVTLDDLHWADVPSLELLAYLAPRLSASHVLLAAAYRDVGSERSSDLDSALATVSREDAAEELVLRGLPHHDVAGLAGHVSGAPVPEEIVTLLHERTSGNPFFVRQLSQLMLESKGGPVSPRTLPPGIRHVLKRRMASLPASSRQVIDVAAVLGRDFDVTVVAEAADVPVDRALDELDVAVRHGLVEAGGMPARYRFVHGLVQESVYDTLAPGRALKLHARVAVALEAASAPTDQLAEQMWRAAELLGDDRPLRYTLAAAEQATSLLAYEQAELYLHRALHLLGRAPSADPEAEFGVVLNLFQLIATNRGWGSPAARDVVQRARQLIDDSDGLQGNKVHLWFSLWMSLNSRNELETADEVSVTLMKHADADMDPVARVAGLLMLAFRAFRQPHRWRDGVRELQLAKAAVKVAPAGSLAAFPEHLEVVLLLTEAETAALLGDPRASALNDEAIALAEAAARPLPRALAYTVAALNCALLSDAPNTRRHAQAARKLDEQLGFSFLARVAEYTEAWADAYLGADPAEQARRIRDVIDFFNNAGDAPSEAYAYLLLADVLVLGGDRAAARDSLDRVRQSPGPYAHVVLHYVDQKMAALHTDSTATAADPTQRQHNSNRGR